VNFAYTTVFDALGNVDDELKTVSNSYGRSLTFTDSPYVTVSDPEGYNSERFVVTDETGRSVRFRYNPDLKTRVILPDGSRRGFDCEATINFSATGVVPCGLIDVGLIYNLEFGGLRAFKMSESALGVYSTLTFDLLGPVTQYTDRLGRITNYFAGQIVGGQSYAAGSMSKPSGATYAEIFGDSSLPLQKVDPLGRVTKFEYDGASRLRKVTNPEGDSVESTYDVRSNVLSTTKRPKPGSSLVPIVSSTIYNEAANIFQCITLMVKLGLA
jgi:YD repeat-containing protein